jgi:hypothetical protein
MGGLPPLLLVLEEEEGGLFGTSLLPLPPRLLLFLSEVPLPLPEEEDGLCC